MIFQSFCGQPPGPTPKRLREQALGAAIVFRNCARSVETSHPGRRACRALMRAQALQWREGAFPAAPRSDERA